MVGKKLLKAGLFIAFIICLIVSIPHLAWVFNSFETGDSSTLRISWITVSQAWLFAYLQAISIDGIIALVSLILTNRKQYTSKLIGYIFIAGLTGISWLFNWIYDKAHQPIGSVWNGTILAGHISTVWLVPIITSALPVLAIAFTIMIDTMTGDHLSAEELRQILQEKADLAAMKKSFANPGKASLAERIKSGIAGGLSIVAYAKDETQKTLSTPKLQLQLPEKTQERERNTDELKAIGSQESGQESLDQLQIREEEIGSQENRKQIETLEEKGEKTSIEKLPEWLSTGGSTISLDEIVKHLKISRKMLRNRVESKIIRCTKNKEIVYKDSLIDWMQKEGILKIPGQPMPDKMEMTLKQLEINPAITDQELATKLGLMREASARFWRMKAQEILKANPGKKRITQKLGEVVLCD
jgi:hypothetical protein